MTDTTPEPTNSAATTPAPTKEQARIGRTSEQYGSDQIKVLEGLEAVRKRPGMYIGGTGLNALHHLVYEVVDNSIDEAMAGHATRVTVTIQTDGSVCVTDDGRGIPVDPITSDDPLIHGRSAIEIVLTKLHAGGKFGQEGSAYKVSGGLHGVGVSCVNALSSHLEAVVDREGSRHRIAFRRGAVIEPLHVVGPTPGDVSSVGSGEKRHKRGTMVTFRPDDTIFPDTTFSYNTLANRLRELAYLNPGVTIELTDERVDDNGERRSEKFHADNGLLAYVQHLMVGKTAVASEVYLKKEDEERNLVCEVALQYHDGYNELLLTFANNINNKDGGTHGQGFKLALTRCLNSYARRVNIIRDKDPTPTGEDLREGLIAIISVKLPDPAFNNQPKERLLNPEIEGFVSAAVGEALEAWLEQHPGEAKKLCQKGVMAAQAREAARKARELTRRKSALESGSMPHKLRDCKTKDVDRSELFLVEGDSAGGSATQGRDVDTQAILPLRGKLLNVEKARIDKILGFEEIRTLIQALRCGIGVEMDLTKLRYGKVVIMTDADVDGSHIRTLLLTFFFRQMPELIRRGHVYIAQPPLYQVLRGSGRKKSSRYVLDERELFDTVTDMALQHASLVVRDIDPDDPLAPPTVLRRLEGNDARRAVRVLGRLRDLVRIAERRGVGFAQLLAARDDDPLRTNGQTGRLPRFKVSAGTEDLFFWTETDANAAVHERGWRLTESMVEIDENADEATADTTMNSDAGETSASPTKSDPAAGPDAALLRPVVTVRELHENIELESVFAELSELGLDIERYSDQRLESVSGDQWPTRFAWETSRGMSSKSPESPEQESAGAGEKGDDSAESVGAPSGNDEASSVADASGSGNARVIEAPNLAEILTALDRLGRRGLEIKRFKGLGEMDAEQLWETTMDASKRVLLRVTWEQASNAEQLFSILMGEAVEPRRKFIEEHALEVKNLDV